MTDLNELEERIDALESDLEGYQKCLTCGTVRAKSRADGTMSCKVCKNMLFKDLI